MGQSGQCSDPSLPLHHTNGLPLVPGLIELSTVETVAAGGRHVGYPPHTLLVRSSPGQPRSPAAQYSGVRWIRPENWLPFQKRTFVTPAFPGYVSGHSTFSRAASEILTAFTGSPFFPGGLGTFTAPKNSYLTFELGPSENVQLQWATYFDAADQSGMSRIRGGIHPPVDDFTGRQLGRRWVAGPRNCRGGILTARCERRPRR